MSGILCAGDVYFDRLDSAGAPTGVVYLFDSKKFAITEPVETKTRESKGRDTYGQNRAVVTIKKGATVDIEGDEVNGKVLALQLMGDIAALAQGSGTVTAAAVTLKQNVFNQLPWVNIAEAGTVLTDSAAATTYVEGTDYIMHRRLGWIQPITPAAAAAGNKLSYAYSAITGEVIAGGSRPIIRGRLILDGINLENEKPIIVDIDEARLAPKGEIDFASDNFAKAALGGPLITQPGKTRPYTVQLRD